VALTDMQVRRYAVTSNNGPLVAIPFTVSESGDYVLEFKTNEDGIESKATAAAPAVYIVEYNITANKNFETIIKNTAATLVGHFDFSKLSAADVYNVLLDESAQEKTPASIPLTAGKKYIMVFYCDGKSLKYNNMTTYGAVADNFTVGSSGGIYVDDSLLVANYKQNIYLSGIRLTPKDDFKEAVSALAFSADKKRLDVGEAASTSVKLMYSLSGEKEVTDGISYESSDEGVATVDQNGKITAVSEGSATITATHSESDLSDSIEISVFNSSLNTPFELDFSNVTAYRNPESSPSCVLNTENGVFSLSDIHVRRYGVTSEHGPFLAIPFKVAREGDYAIEVMTSSATIENKDTAGAPAVYILKGELSANMKFASLPGVTSSTKPVGYIDFSKITTADTYADVTTDGTFAGVISTTHLEEGKHLAVFAFDGKSLELNNVTAGGAVDLSVYDCDTSGVRTIDGDTILSTAYKQHISVSGMRFVPEKDLSDEFRGIKIVPETNALDIGESAKIAPYERWSLGGDKKTLESFIYRSSDDSVATVSEDGVVTAHNYGNVIITA
ncbi:MAG: Ig-like domain-containing protein, partial [Oscillospiraceae bacterium]|nr:Ig-like domain-containing protein [Oscillospiraceae bacterium]